MVKGSPEEGWEYRESTEKDEWIGANGSESLKETEELRNNGPLQSLFPKGPINPYMASGVPPFSFSLSSSFSDFPSFLLCLP